MIERVADHARRFFARELEAMDPGGGPHAAERFAEAAVDEAGRYQLLALADLLLFASLAAVHGLGWAQAPRRRWLHEILMDPRLPPPRRLQRAAQRSLHLAEEVA